MSWFVQVREAGVAAAARDAGLVADASKLYWGPCPVCGAHVRSSSDPRRPIGTTSDGLGWRCHACKAGGDAVSLLAAVATGQTRPSNLGWRDIRDRFPPPGQPGRGALESTGGVRRPPRRDLLELRARGVAVTQDESAVAWCERKGLDPHRVADADLAWVLPPRFPSTRWMWSRGGPWWQTDHRLLVPMYDESGEWVTVHARTLDPDAPPKWKAVSPCGFGIRGSVMADALGVLLLRDGSLLDGTPASVAVRDCRGGLCLSEGYVRCGLVIAEGVPDFMLAATHWSDGDEDAPAVLGVISGSWSAQIAARVPDCTRVMVATDADEQGERYAKRIRDSLADRCRVLRWYPRHRSDES